MSGAGIPDAVVYGHEDYPIIQVSGFCFKGCLQGSARVVFGFSEIPKRSSSGLRFRGKRCCLTQGLVYRLHDSAPSASLSVKLRVTIVRYRLLPGVLQLYAFTRSFSVLSFP